MSIFSSSYTALIDDKGRVVLPAPFKKAMGAMADEKIIIEKDYFKNCLNIYPEKIFREKEESIISKLDPFKEEDENLRESFYENHTYVYLTEIGRISIPADFTRYIIDVKKSKEVVFTGNGDYVKLWASETYEAHKKAKPSIGEMLRTRNQKNQ